MCFHQSRTHPAIWHSVVLHPASETKQKFSPKQNSCANLHRYYSKWGTIQIVECHLLCCKIQLRHHHQICTSCNNELNNCTNKICKIFAIFGQFIASEWTAKNKLNMFKPCDGFVSEGCISIAELAANSDFWAILWQNNKVSSGPKETKCLGNYFLLPTDLKTINLPNNP